MVKTEQVVVPSNLYFVCAEFNSEIFDSIDLFLLKSSINVVVFGIRGIVYYIICLGMPL